MKRKLIVAVVAVLVFGAAFAVVKKKRELAALPKPQVAMPAVQSAMVSTGTLETTVHYLGQIEPYSKADLSARISGNILTINKREGDRVREGEEIVAIDDRELTQRAEATQAALLAARQNLAGTKSAYETQQAVYDRDVVLAKAGAISEEALEHYPGDDRYGTVRSGRLEGKYQELGDEQRGGSIPGWLRAAVRAVRRSRHQAMERSGRFGHTRETDCGR